ncbi:MAG: urease accessory protein UreF [Phycisphaerae bacterium]
MTEDWLLWQLADSAFPTGGFGHSGGLEAAVQHGQVSDDADVMEFVRQALWQAVYGTAPFVAAARDFPERALEWDERLDAMMSSGVANRASRAQGQALLSTVVRVFPSEELRAWRVEGMARGAEMHFAVVFGLVLRRLGVERGKGVRLFMFVTMRGLVSAAVRLGVVGPLRGQQIQLGLAGELERAAERAERVTVEEAGQSSPLMELLQGTHDRLYSRLFQS